jgi:F-type H+-transporting ATPase subunit epsilon
MEKDNIRLEVVTPEGQIFNEMVESVSVPAVIGSTGILYNHAPLMSALEIGVVKYTCEGAVAKIAIGGGFMEVKDNEVMVLVKTAEKAEDIDLVRAQNSLERAMQRIQEHPIGTDIERAKISLARAKARLAAKE